MGNKHEARSGWQDSRLMTLSQLVTATDNEETGRSIGDPTVRFRVPIYQRLYVWKKEQIERLLNDILDAWKAGNADYYIGGTLVVERQSSDRQSQDLELIDGQQRLTTLLLTALYRLDAQKQPVESSSSYHDLLFHPGTASAGRDPRLHFEIRDKANIWLHTALRKGLKEARKLNLAEEQAHDNFGISPHNETISDDTPRDGGIVKLEYGIEIIEEWFTNNSTLISDQPQGQCDFDTYLLNHVRMLVTSVPGTMDLNHLFETINDRSVQLEHHEVLKARMLKWLKGDDNGEGKEGTYTACARIWEACSAMDDYWEDALAEAAGKNKVNVYEAIIEHKIWRSGALGGSVLSSVALSGKAAIDLCRPKDVAQNSDPAKDEVSLEKLVKDWGNASDLPSNTDKAGDGDHAEKQSSASLISFPMLLLHTLRIWLHRHGPKGADLERFDSFKLLETFDALLLSDNSMSHPLPDIRERVKSFIELLWEVRFLLDQYIIRWVELKEGGEWGHRILRLEQNKSTSLRRADAEQSGDKELSLLQSMLYHSQDIRQLLWLTPLLGYLHSRTFPTEERSGQTALVPSEQGTESDLTVFMRHLDNGLFSSPSLGSKNSETEAESLLQRSRAFLEKPWRSFKKPTIEPLHGGFHGTDDMPRTSHYWYYKADFVIWRRYQGGSQSNESLPQLQGQNDVTQGQLEDAWQHFRFTARASVEHIRPQTSQEEGQEKEGWGDALHSFGNLALVSRERNSEFSNKPYHEKRVKYLTRLRQKDLQSPKLALVYLYGGVPEPSGLGLKHGEWGAEHAKAHMEWIERSMEEYFSLAGYSGKKIADTEP